VTLVDFHDPPQTNEWLVSGAILVIDAFRTKTRSLPYLYPAYFAEGVVAARSQFEGAAGLSVTVKEIVPSNRRFVADEKLVAEALEGLQSNRWPNVHQAALALERRAEGASPQAKVRRLSDKIRKAMS
jgi:hypothetical protein